MLDKVKIQKLLDRRLVKGPVLPRRGTFKPCGLYLLELRARPSSKPFRRRKLFIPIHSQGCEDLPPSEVQIRRRKND
jgi:hypothetical protein